MATFGFNSKYLLKDGKPWFPVMGEIHYSRCDRRFWRETVQKMLSGGVDIISSYVIWIHHEEIENEFDFSEKRDVKAFLDICRECGAYVWLRIGPWCHGEVRNGGFPDWLINKPFPLRENNNAYLAEVRKYLTRVYAEVEGALYKNGGPIIGIQIENEYGHCGGLTGAEGEAHMKTLLQLAKDIGFDVPMYTATGWGGAITAGMLPVMGGYCDAPWDQSLTELEPSGNFIFTYERNDHNIGSDYGLGAGLTFDAAKFPYLTAELGGGLQVTKHRRPIAAAADIGSISLVKLGSGVNLLGYYMYCGGTNPVGKLSTLQESRATGYPNDLPELSYDFNAPIKEFGQISETYKELRLFSMFLHDFGEELCGMDAHIPAENPLDPSNLTDLRCSVRDNGESGYFFVNNYVRRHKMAEHKGVTLSAVIGGNTYSLPETDIFDGDYFFCPINMKIGAGAIISSLTTPLCKLDDRIFVFYGKDCYITQGSISPCGIITLTREQAKNSCKLKLDREYLAVTDLLIVKEDGYVLYSGKDAAVELYPKPRTTPQGFSYTDESSGLYRYEKHIDSHSSQCSFDFIREVGDRSCYEITVDYAPNIHECMLYVDWQGDTAELFVNGERRTDAFYTGQRWEIGLRELNFPKTLQIEIETLSKSAPIYLERLPKFVDGKANGISGAAVSDIYRTRLTF